MAQHLGQKDHDIMSPKLYPSTPLNFPKKTALMNLFPPNVHLKYAQLLLNINPKQVPWIVHLLTFTTKISTTCLIIGKIYHIDMDPIWVLTKLWLIFFDIPEWTSQGCLLPHVIGSWLKLPISRRPSWSSYVIACWHFIWWISFLILNLSRNKNTCFPSTKSLKQINKMFFYC